MLAMLWGAEEAQLELLLLEAEAVLLRSGICTKLLELILELEDEAASLPVGDS